MPRTKKKSLQQNDEKPSWMLAAEERLSVAEKNSKSKGKDTTKLQKQKPPSLYETKSSTVQQTVTQEKPAWMLAAEERLKDEASEKKLKRNNQRTSSTVKGVKSSHQVTLTTKEQEEVQKNSTSSSVMPTTKELNLLKEILDENKKENLKDINKKNDISPVKLSDEDYYDQIKVDTTLDDVAFEKEIEDSDERQNSFLKLIEATKQRMRDSCEKATKRREEYVNIRSTVPVFTTSLPESDSDDDDNNNNNSNDDESNDYWGLDENEINKEDNLSRHNTLDIVPKKSYQELKDEFFKNIDRLQLEVCEAREEHCQTVTSMHNEMKQIKV